RAIEFEPNNSVLYGELGVLYHKNRNYETGILALKCAVRGCTEEESCDGRGGCGQNDVPSEVQGLPLSQATVYYYDIYASELAALSTPRQSYCAEALDIAGIIESSEYIQDPNIAADMVVVRRICAFDTAANAAAGVRPTATPMVTPTSAP
ncbi:MAG TPA: tetratricopeptide repeat protein, partial [Anaerolineales bacterium]|nr:tetratricopeptide repeat protein [Anaerolineales bacterium]